jgi:hypothetical protein
MSQILDRHLRDLGQALLGKPSTAAQLSEKAADPLVLNAHAWRMAASAY